MYIYDCVCIFRSLSWVAKLWYLWFERWNRIEQVKSKGIKSFRKLLHFCVQYQLDVSNSSEDYVWFKCLP